MRHRKRECPICGGVTIQHEDVLTWYSCLSCHRTFALTWRNILVETFGSRCCRSAFPTFCDAFGASKVEDYTGDYDVEPSDYY